MPVEAKPLIRPDVLRTHVAAFDLPPHVAGFAAKLAHWASLLATGRADTFREQELLPDFLTDFFVTLLGYVRPADGGPRYTISREKHVEVDGKFADAVLGDFRHLPSPSGRGQGEGRAPSPLMGEGRGEGFAYIAALEGKGPRDPLDRPFAGRRMSAVDQAYRYAINLPCDFVIVTSIRQTRLYHKGSDQHTYESFDTEQLADDPAALKRFVFLLGAERVVPAAGRCHLYDLLSESEKVGRELTKEFYLRYADMRQDAFGQLARDNPHVSRIDVLSSTQKLLDRVLFCAFCEDRGLLPVDTIRRAYEHRDPYHPRPIWDNFRGLFGAINRGNAALGIHAYNGGLFAEDTTLDALAVSDAVCGYLRDLGGYDYRPAHQAAAHEPSAASPSGLIDVDILGHIFEQSITDLERLRNELENSPPSSPVAPRQESGAPTDPTIPLTAPPSKASRRKKEGAFYTPAFITRYIIEQALGGVLADRFEQLRQRHQAAAKGTAAAALADPNVYDLARLKKPERAGLVRFWEAWQDELAQVRLLDPACGSGAFLIQAFDQLHATYQASNDRLHELRGHRTLFDLDKRILENNLYGVDLNEEAIEICRLSLWIKTAERGKQLTSLDHTIRVGNSVVSDPVVHPRALDWQATFPEVFSEGAGGFDVVAGNPPYVRQELLSPIKPYLQTAYCSYHGMADLYVYFYELGLRLLKPGGLLSFIVTNKWMKSGYGEPLRRFFGAEAWIESVVDFGHAKQIFVDADVFPSIIVARKPTTQPKPTTARLCTIPREQLRIDDLSRQIAEEGVALPLSQLAADAWQLEPSGVGQLSDRIAERGIPLHEYVGSKPLTGIKTAFNDAYLIDTPTRDALIAAHPKCAELIHPYVRGADIGRWCLHHAGYWMITMKSSGDHAWPWSHQGDRAEDVFRDTFPSVHQHMKQFETALRKRQDQGHFWWELRSCAYWERFARPKLYYQLIQYHPCYAYDDAGMFGNNKTAFILADDLYLLAVLNSPLMWWYNWRYLPHMKDEALAPNPTVLEGIPIASANEEMRSTIEGATRRVIEIETATIRLQANILDWLRVEHEIEKPSLKLQAPVELDCDAFVAEVKKGRGRSNPLSAAALRSLREEHARTIEPARALAAEALALEHQISDLVNAAYGLTPEEIALMWQTAPPRMPIGRDVEGRKIKLAER